jgi:hypothetical protein
MDCGTGIPTHPNNTLGRRAFPSLANRAGDFGSGNGDALSKEWGRGGLRLRPDPTSFES